MATKRSKKSSTKKSSTKKSSTKKTAAGKSPIRKRQLSKPLAKRLSTLNLGESIIDAEWGNFKTQRKARPNFYDKVYAIVEHIPIGKVTTYGAIAETLGMKGSSRMVGNALNAIPAGSDLPAQRVINRIGALSGAHHFGGYARMRKILLSEGVTFKGELVEMKLHFWHPKDLR